MGGRWISIGLPGGRFHNGCGPPPNLCVDRRSDGAGSADAAEKRATVAEKSEVTVISGDRYYVVGDTKQVERTVLDASRGAIMQLAWMTDAETNEPVGLNPAHVVALRAAKGQPA
jgi:hypothetical protein